MRGPSKSAVEAAQDVLALPRPLLALWPLPASQDQQRGQGDGLGYRIPLVFEGPQPKGYEVTGLPFTCISSSSSFLIEPDLWNLGSRGDSSKPAAFLYQSSHKMCI